MNATLIITEEGPAQRDIRSQRKKRKQLGGGKKRRRARVGTDITLGAENAGQRRGEERKRNVASCGKGVALKPESNGGKEFTRRDRSPSWGSLRTVLKKTTLKVREVIAEIRLKRTCHHGVGLPRPGIAFRRWD